MSIGHVDGLRDRQTYRLRPTGALVQALYHRCPNARRAGHESCDPAGDWMLVATRYAYAVDRESGRLNLGQVWRGEEPVILPGDGLPTPHTVHDLEPVEWSGADDNGGP